MCSGTGIREWWGILIKPHDARASLDKIYLAGMECGSQDHIIEGDHKKPDYDDSTPGATFVPICT